MRTCNTIWENAGFFALSTLDLGETSILGGFVQGFEMFHHFEVLRVFFDKRGFYVAINSFL